MLFFKITRFKNDINNSLFKSYHSVSSVPGLVEAIQAKRQSYRDNNVKYVGDQDSLRLKFKASIGVFLNKKLELQNYLVYYGIAERDYLNQYENIKIVICEEEK
jgi:hypothetical protein